MKQSFTPSTGRERLSRAQTTPILLALALGWLAAGAPLAHAQDDTLPLAANVDQLRVTVGGRSVPVSYARIDSANFRFFPGITFKTAFLKQGNTCVNFVDAAGRLAPSLNNGGILEATFYDYVNDALARSNLLEALRSQVGLGANASFQPARVLPGRTARLVMSDPAANGRVQLLAEGPLSSSSGPEPVASFALTPGIVGELRRLQSLVPNAAAHLNVFIVQEYQAQFQTTDLQANLSFVEQSLSDLRQRLVSSPGRPTPNFVFAAYSPLQLPTGGSVDKDTQFANVLRRSVQVEILQRLGSRPNEALVQRLLDDALRLVNLRITPTAEERQTAIGTLLLDDGIQITTPIANLSNVAASVRSDSQHQWSDAFQRAIRNSGSSEIRGSVDVDTGFYGLGAGGSADFETIQRWNNSDYVNQKREDYARRLEEAAAQLSGQIPVLTGMRFNQSGQVSSINFDDIRFRLGSFTIGQATLETELSLRDYATTLGQAQQVEALLVPQVLVGKETVVGPAGWHQLPGEWAIFHDTQVTFPKPFASPPSVVTALNIINNATHSELIFVDAENITATGFTMHFGAHPESRYHWARASWIATGEKRVTAGSSGGLASLGTPGLPPLIPTEARQAVLTPQLQSAPQLADGQFRASFNAIPGRTYNVEASSTLRPDDWSFLGSITASDFLAGFDMADIGSHPQRFFRISTP